MVAILVASTVWLGISVGGALAAPGTDTVAARLAEWGRVHGLGWIVTDLEQVQYQMNKPKTGGSVAGGIPTIGADAPRPTTTSRPRYGVPAPITPPAANPLPGEGTWQNLLTVKARTAARVAYVRPDQIHSSYLVSVVWMDPSLLRFELHPGNKVPGPPLMKADQIPAAELQSVLATFNSGFQMFDANGGYWQKGTAIKPLQAGAASMVFSTDGHLKVEKWPGGTPGPGVAAVRQNLTMLIDHGQVSPLVASATTNSWGKTVGNAAYVWRSAIGVRADGSVVFVVGPAMNIQSLANVLHAAGAVEAMELDINEDWTNYLTYTHPGPGQAVPHKLTSNMVPNPHRYLEPSSRDFVAVFGR